MVALVLFSQPALCDAVRPLHTSAIRQIPQAPPLLISPICRSSASASEIDLPGASPEQLAEIGELKGKLEEAEAALQSADQEAQVLHLQLQRAEERVMAAERAADEAAEAVESAHQRVLADVAAVAVSVGGQTVGGRRVWEGFR